MTRTIRPFLSDARRERTEEAAVEMAGYLLDLAKDALTFGAGPHFCPGANVARTEIRIMLEAALDFLPEDARLLEERVQWSSKGLLGQIKTLPVDFRRGLRGSSPAIPGQAIGGLTSRSIGSSNSSRAIARS